MTRIQTGINQRELRWKPAARFLKHDIPPRLRSWLFDQTSLTARLQHYCGQHGFRVQLFTQRRDAVTHLEARSLGLTSRRLALVRQVYLLCGEQVVVFARTIIPLSSLKGRQRRLANLGQRSLGAVLFADKSMRRGNLEIVRVEVKRRPSPAALAQFEPGTVLWGRRSKFTLNGHQLLVSEFFLPALLDAGQVAD